MKKIITSLLALLGLAACSQQVYDNTYEVDSFTTPNGKTIRIHALVHSSMRIEYDGKEIQIDPVTKLGEKTMDYASMPKADYIFITHGHHDHLDTAADTEDIPEMAELKDIDIAFLPCNQPYTMTVDQLLKAARMVKPKVLFPYHYGQTDVSSISSQLEADGIEVRIRHYE